MITGNESKLREHGKPFKKGFSMKNFVPMLTLVCSMSAFAESITLTQGLARPESAYILEESLFISNQSGGGMLKDGIGWIQKLDLNGNIIEEKWVEGLNAPKGLRSDGKKLYAADIDELVVIDLFTKAVEKIKVEGAILLNDVVVDRDGTVLVSDTWGQKIYRVNAQTKEVSLMVSLEEAPNGLLISGETLYVGGYAKPNATRNGPVAGTKGSLISIHLSTGEQKEIIKDMGLIDGIEEAKDGLLIVTMKDSVGPHSINWVDPKAGKVVGSLAGVTSYASITDAADLAYDAKSGIIYLPNTNQNNIQIIYPE